MAKDADAAMLEEEEEEEEDVEEKIWGFKGQKQSRLVYLCELFVIYSPFTRFIYCYIIIQTAYLLMAIT
jgi:hypothetical protein